ncbi:protoporphyrinogen oxidase HemJ [Pseudoroseicyclus sp. CXY001]|uniref:protoporphyrinogen oxidase HemJ n=1 Tax=Pseudoroseicyclus sp. CXY001 TaxID=3242492 RepID=UPI003570E5C5
MIGDFLTFAYPTVKSLHVIAMVAWMAGMFYLPRLFVYHAEQAAGEPKLESTFRTMERRLLRAIMNPAMIATWIFGLMLVFTPGVVDWHQGWPWGKALGVLGMSGVHGWLSKQRKAFEAGTNTVSGRTYRMVNEIPTVLLILIVVMVIARPF